VKHKFESSTPNGWCVLTQNSKASPEKFVGNDFG